MTYDLDGRKFRPVRNSQGGRVASDAVFNFSQAGSSFLATYQGEGFSDGHLIGEMSGEDIGRLIYHCRAADGSLEAGEAEARFSTSETGNIEIAMKWQWLNGTKASGVSRYEEIQ